MAKRICPIAVSFVAYSPPSGVLPPAAGHGVAHRLYAGRHTPNMYVTVTRVVLAATVVLAVLAGAATATDHADRQYAQSDQAVTFDDRLVQTQQGDVAELTLAFEGVDAATLVVGGDEVGYELTAAVTDGDGDGTVVLLFDTHAAGGDGDVLVAVGADDAVEVSDETSLDGRLDIGDYDADVYAGETTDGDATDIATLVLNEAAEPTETDAGTEGDAPGFGVAAAVGALLVAGFVARRR